MAQSQKLYVGGVCLGTKIQKFLN